MDFETLLSGWEFLEAPRIDAAGNLYFSDVTVGGLHKLLPDGGLRASCRTVPGSAASRSMTTAVSSVPARTGWSASMKRPAR